MRKKEKSSVNGLCVSSYVSDKLHKQTRELMKELENRKNPGFRIHSTGYNRERMKNNGEY